MPLLPEGVAIDSSQPRHPIPPPRVSIPSEGRGRVTGLCKNLVFV